MQWNRHFRLDVLSTVLVVAGASQTAMAQSFPGFTPGNIVVSRSVYTGDASILAVGQPLPPVCPSTASCGTGKATDSGAYPSTTGSNNVWNNDSVDGSFGITSPIFLDQLTPTGTESTRSRFRPTWLTPALARSRRWH